MTLVRLVVLVSLGAYVAVSAQEEDYESRPDGTILVTDEMLKPTETIANALAITPPDGWSRDGEVERFVPANLYDKINGRSELYMSYDVVGMAWAQFRRAGSTDTVEVFLYDMGKPLHAFGVYSVEREADAMPVPLGRAGYRTGTDLPFWTGPYYVVVQGIDESRPVQDAVLAIAQALDQRLKGGDEPLWGLAVLPRQNRLDHTLQYFLVDALSLDFLQNTFTVEYKLGETAYKAFVSGQESPQDAERVESQYGAYLAKYADAPERIDRDGAMFTAADLGAGYYDVIFRKGAYVAGVTAVKGRDTAIEAAAALHAGLDAESP